MTVDKMLAARLHAPNDLRLDEVAIPEAPEGCVLVRVSHSGICGSDLPRIFEQGTYRFPLIPGHEFAGDAPDGRRVAVIPLIPCGRCRWCAQRLPFHCEGYDFLGSRSDGGMAQYAVAPASNVLPVPEKVSPEEAAMMEPIAVACHCARQADVQPGDSVLVFGAGAIGNFCAQWAREMGAGLVRVVDIRPEALERVRAAGLEGIDGSVEDPVGRLLDATRGLGADVVIEASGSPAALYKGIECVRRRGTLALIGRVDRDCVLPGPTLTSILRKELHICGVWGFNHWDFPHNDWEMTLGALERKSIIVEPLITHRYSLGRIGEALEMMRSGREYYCKVLILPWGQ